METNPTSAPPHPEDPAAWGSSELTDLLQRVLQLAEDTRSAIADRLDLNRSEVTAMEHLMSGNIGPVALSRRLHMSSASATVLVDRLERSGHVTREADPDDRRRRVVRPTEQGATAVFEQLGPLVVRLVAAESALTGDERTIVMSYLQRVAEALSDSGYSADPPAAPASAS